MSRHRYAFCPYCQEEVLGTLEYCELWDEPVCHGCAGELEEKEEAEEEARLAQIAEEEREPAT